jgi:hypothetical protein
MTVEEYQAEVLSRIDAVVAIAATFSTLGLVCLGILAVRALSGR